MRFCETEGPPVWRAIEPWHQDSKCGSCVDASHISELISFGFIALESRGSQSFAVVSETGSKALAERTAREIREIFRHLKYAKLEPKTY
jgi:hypothetical protein